MKTKTGKTKLLLILLFLVGAPKAYAYLDPGTGSYFFQLLIAALLGIAFSAKVFWKKLKAWATNIFLRKRRGKKHSL